MSPPKRKIALGGQPPTVLLQSRSLYYHICQNLSIVKLKGFLLYNKGGANGWFSPAVYGTLRCKILSGATGWVPGGYEPRPYEEVPNTSLFHNRKAVQSVRFHGRHKPRPHEMVSTEKQQPTTVLTTRKTAQKIRNHDELRIFLLRFISRRDKPF